MYVTPLLWRFVTINTHGSWLHGDPRGFRSREHRIHSSGDYRNPPPAGEHAGLYQYQLKRSGEKVRIPEPLRGIVGSELVRSLANSGYRVWALSVSSDHSHGLVELPDDIRAIRHIVGDAKKHASRAVKDQMPGSIWSARGGYDLVRDRAHLENCIGYVLFEQGAGTWTWSAQEREVIEMIVSQRANRDRKNPGRR